jgi:ubiquinone/menaquinone biosynthesis methyltransferase
MESNDLYSPSYVKSLFDEMARTYGGVNLISSFGFAKRWREICVRQAGLKPGMVVYDWMSGMGECWGAILARIGASGHITGVDISTAMCQQSKESPAHRQFGNVWVLEEDVLNNSLEDESADCVISSFGLKTFSDEQKNQLAKEIWRVLKLGGRFSLLEISVPENLFLRVPYVFYIKYCIPLIGFFFLGNPDNYRMLGWYTEKFRNCKTMQTSLEKVGFQVQFQRHFSGCATSVFGIKPFLNIQQMEKQHEEG